MDAILEIRAINKYYASLAANQDINLRVKRGTVHAIIGENGAGKSTLMNILAGVVKPDSGEILLNGKVQRFSNAMDASRAGIGMVQQEFMLFSGLSVLENIILGAENKTKTGFLNLSSSENKIRSICSAYGFNFDLHANVDDLPIVLQQQVEIVKVLYRDADIIILDEPTAVLPPQEVDGLFKAVRFLLEQGKTILFITHKLKEVLAISDEITVMKSGKVVGNLPVEEADETILTQMMVGRDVMLEIEKDPEIDTEIPLLECENLRVQDLAGIPRVKDVSFQLYKGEILGIVGISGNGQSELVKAITGTNEYAGKVSIQGKAAKHLSPRDARMEGMGYVPQDRGTVGSSGISTLVENMLMGTHLKRFRKHRILMDYPEGQKFTQDVIEKFRVKAQSCDDSASSLSGGNLQKLIVGREFSQNNSLLIMEDPTRGIDVGAIEFIWNEIVRQVEEEKVSVLLISYDLNEAMTLSDRILVLYDGTIVKEFKGPDYDEYEIGLYMLGGKQ